MATGVSFRDARPAGAGQSAGAGGGGVDSWLRSHRTEAFGAAAAGIVVVIALARKKGSASATSSSAAAPPMTTTQQPGTGVPPSSYYDSSSTYDALAQQIQGLASQLGAMGASTPAAAVTSVPPATTGSPGPPTISIGGALYDVLGVIPPGGMAAYHGWQVGGGAPVYFGDASAIAQGPTYQQPGKDVYTPDAYRSLVWGPA